MTTTIPNCPQSETPIRDRAWTDEQVTEVCEALLRQRQCDHDGMECIVSREACCIAADMLRSTLTHTRPARSGGVSDADVEVVIKSAERVNTDGMDGDSWDRILVRYALTHFAKGAEVGGDESCGVCHEPKSDGCVCQDEYRSEHDSGDMER